MLLVSLYVIVNIASVTVVIIIVAAAAVVVVAIDWTKYANESENVTNVKKKLSLGSVY